MQKAKNEIIQTSIDGEIYFWGVLEKENQSGILFNERLFVLRPTKEVGYISNPSAPLTKNLLSSLKSVIEMHDIKTVVAKQKQLSIKFMTGAQQRKVQKIWLFRATSQTLAKDWQDKIKIAKNKEILSKIPPKLIQEEEQFRKQAIRSNTPKKKDPHLSFNRMVEYSANPKSEKVTKDIGVEAQSESLENIKPQKQIETKEFGIYVNQNEEPKAPSPSEHKDVCIGTSFKFQEEPIREQPSAKQPIRSQQPNPHNDTSQAVKPPENRKINWSQLGSIRAQTPRQQPNPIISQYRNQEPIRKEKQNDSEQPPVVLNQTDRPSRIKETEEKEKLDLSQWYYNRTSQIVRQSSIAHPAHNQLPRQEEPPPEQINKRQYSPPPYQTRQNPQTSDSQLSYLPFQDRLNPSVHFSPIEQNNSAQQIHSIKQEQEQIIFPPTQIPWTFRYFTQKEHMFSDFTDFTEQLMVELLYDLALPPQQQQFQVKYIKNGIRHYEVNDIEAKIALIDLNKTNKWAEREKACSKQSIKTLENEYNNYQALYECLGNSSKLKVPLVCLHEISGVVGLFKVLSRGLEKQIRPQEIESDLELIKATAKIELHMPPSHYKYLVALDPFYYGQFKQRSQGDSKASFNYILIQQLERFLLPDLVSDQENIETSLLRKQLVELYAAKPLRAELNASNKKELEALADNVLKSISAAIQEIDSLQAYFFNSTELSNYLHSKGINIRYLGHIYEYLQTPFQKQFLLSEIAARTCKTLLRKTVQDLQLERCDPKEIYSKTCQFLNSLLGNTYETSTMWKLLSTHSQLYFGVKVTPQEVQKGSLLVALAEQCRLDLVWERINPEEIFALNFFFSERNFKGVKPKHKIYPPVHNEFFQETANIVSTEESQEGFQRIVNNFGLQSKGLPQLLEPISADVKKYLAYFINPTDSALPHLAVYPHLNTSAPSRSNFEIALTEIKWLLKLKKKEQYIAKCDEFIKTATKLYGEYHPVFSQLYDVFSAYHSSHDEPQEAITFAKSSLVNTLALCGTYHSKTSECYYYLAIYYLKANRMDDALHNFKKAKKHLEHIKKTDSLSYAAVLIKLALIHLNQNQSTECLINAQKALDIVERIETQRCEDELTDCYQMIARGYQLENKPQELKKLSQRIGPKLKMIHTRSNMQKMLKMYLYPLLSDLTQQNASSYLDIIALLPKQQSTNSEALALANLQNRIAEPKFQLLLYEYFKRIDSIEKFIRQNDVLRNWQSFRQNNERQTVDDFLNLTEELLVFLGEGFMLGALREAL